MEAFEGTRLPIEPGGGGEGEAPGRQDSARREEGTVRALADRLVIERMTVADARAARIVRERGEAGGDPVATVADAIEIGARVLEREGTAAEVDYVRREFEGVARAAREELLRESRGVVEEIQRQFERAFAEDGGALMEAFGGFEQGLAEQIAHHFGADRSTAVQHQIKEQVSKLVEERLQAMVRYFASEEAANPFADVKRAISHSVSESTRRQEKRVESLGEALQRIESNVVRLAAEAEQQAALSEAEEAGTRKGRSFEERVHLALERIAAGRGDVAHHVGDDPGIGGTKKGDTVVEVGAADGQALGRIVFEDKDKRLSKNEAWSELNAAMAEREAQFAVLVAAGEDSVPAGREQLVEYEGNKVIVAVDPSQPDGLGIELAYRYARLRVLLRREGELELDAAGVRDAAEEARTALKSAQSVRLALTNADKSVAKAREGLDEMVGSVQERLARIESLVAAAEPEGPEAD